MNISTKKKKTFVDIKFRSEMSDPTAVCLHFPHLAVNQKILHEQETEKTFLDLLSSEDSGVVVSGCVGLMSMASLHSSRQLIGCEGGLVKLLQCAQSEAGEVRANAARTIATLINGAPANQKLAIKIIV